MYYLKSNVNRRGGVMWDINVYSFSNNFIFFILNWCTSKLVPQFYYALLLRKPYPTQPIIHPHSSCLNVVGFAFLPFLILFYVCFSYIRNCNISLYKLLRNLCILPPKAKTFGLVITHAFYTEAVYSSPDFSQLKYRTFHFFCE